jgi:hypothetical protein
LIARLNRYDLHHVETVAIVNAERSPLLVPAATIPEVDHFLLHRGRGVGIDRLLADLIAVHLMLDHGEPDLPRIHELVQRYADLPLGYVDAAVIACAERNGGRVLTFDLRHFGVVAREGTIAIVP